MAPLEGVATGGRVRVRAAQIEAPAVCTASSHHIGAAQTRLTPWASGKRANATNSG